MAISRELYRGWGEAEEELLGYLEDGPKDSRQLNELMGRSSWSLMAKLLNDGKIRVIDRVKYGVRSWVRVYALSEEK